MPLDRSIRFGRLALLGWLAAAGPAAASDFMDVRLTWLLGENNLLAGPGETADGSPGLGIGAHNGSRVFFDDYETRYSGFETMGHLVLSKRMPAFAWDFGAEASLFLSLAVGEGRSVQLADQGSFIRLYYDLSGGLADDENVELVLFPISGDRFRMGYSYRASWAGDDFFPRAATAAPAARLQLNLPWGYAFVGFKTSLVRQHIDDSEQTELVTDAGLLAGLGVDLDGLVAEAKGAHFTRGAFAMDGLRGRGLYASGLSYQLGYHAGMPIGTSIDFELYRNDPELERRFFAPEEYPGGLSWRLQHEGSLLWQTLADADEVGRTVDQLGWCFDLNFALKWDYLRVHLDAVVQSLGFLLHREPGFTPYADFPDDAEVEPELWTAVGLDYHFPGPRLTPGLKLGLRRPATYTIADIDVGGVVFAGRRTVVLGQGAPGEIRRDILPQDEPAAWITSLKASLRWDYAEMLGLVAELYYSYDPNQIVYRSDSYGLNVYAEFAEPHVVGLNLMAQARF